MTSATTISRPMGYQYMETLKDHLGDLSCIFNGKLVYPRQLEIHLPGDHKRACNFHCGYCQGRLLDQKLGKWENDALVLLERLKGAIPFAIYGGAYTEPLLNPWLPEFLCETKRHGSYFGIHTNGSLLQQLEEEQYFLSELCSIATSPQDYLSISLDAGASESHCSIKGVKRDWFSEVIEGIRMATEIRGDADHPSIRVCYLLVPPNDTIEEIKAIIDTMQDIGVDSLRFSIPYDNYGVDFDAVKKYRDGVETAFDKHYSKMLEPLLSESANEKPFIFYLPPYHQDVRRMEFSQCIYSYYQITLAADGFVYRCSSIGSPSFKKLRLGRITSDLQAFNDMVLANHDPDFKPSACFGMNGRCNRIALEINCEWEGYGIGKEI